MGSYQPHPDLRLSAHFTLGEFLQSQYAARHGIDMTPPLFVVENLRRLCVGVLEPLRERLRATVRRDAVIVVTSGFRPPMVNAGIGGAPSSAHMAGRAGDIQVPGVSAWVVSAALIGLHEDGKVPALDKAILEFDAWNHAQVANEGREARGEFLRAIRYPGGTRYERMYGNVGRPAA